jgi:hypothetical protein
MAAGPAADVASIVPLARGGPLAERLARDDSLAEAPSSLAVSSVAGAAGGPGLCGAAHGAVACAVRGATARTTVRGAGACAVRGATPGATATPGASAAIQGVPRAGAQAATSTATNAAAVEAATAVNAR